MWFWSTNVTDGQTTCDRKTTFCTMVHRVVKIVPIGDWGYLLTLTLTSDDLESYRREWVIDPNKCHYLVCGCIEFDCGRTDVRTDVPTYRRTFLPGLLGHLGGDDLKMACVLLYSALSANEQNKEKQLSTCFIVIVTVSNSSCSDVINIVYCNYSISIRLRSVCEVINFHSMLNCRTCY